MKKGIKYTAYAMALSIAMSATSCSDFLEVNPTGSLTEEQAFEKIEYIEPLVLGLYKSYRGCKTGRNGLMPYLGTDETQQGNYQLISSGDQAGMDKYNGQLSPTSQQVAAIWNNRWPVVVSAAKVVYALSMTTEDPKRAGQLLGEASFVRGLLMFELSMHWGKIPIVDIARDEELGGKIQPLADVWEAIINDFKKATETLPTSYSGEPQRATVGAAWAMLGKAYMAAPEETGLRDFAKAKACFEEVDKLGYILLDDFADLYDYNKPNSKEALFELQYTNKDPNYWQWDTGSRAVCDWFGGEGTYFGGWDFLVPTPFAYKTVEEGGIWEEGDTRSEISIRYNFDYYTNLYSGDEKVFEWVTPDMSKTTWTGTTDELDPHIKKFEDYRTDRFSGLGINSMYYTGKNHPFIRYADVVLLHAECMNELGQTATAVNLVNDKIRTRAWAGKLPDEMKWKTSMSKEEFREKIMDERMRELCFEGWRRIDLVRTGMFVKLVKERNRWAKESGTIQEFHKLYPIPDMEIKTNEAFSPEDQNPGYIQSTGK
ncbi:RagB/SusD family nutrient uptake outer membrane protein [Bacteroides sp. 51]|uniref:RagB/SusD family nutrient uptake outer membrane protein n=1 Tax=Bacteroides sp. 51 TaxID=2302938 RepID=UPI0013D88766|nr:RagB/SusD family nutrient uptake outer membrane protein [Bacteroides sp. 51]NDV82731.1 RagB/SusD family nutrient uptake outer membrane protein [Bacteroides sp. 51]